MTHSSASNSESVVQLCSFNLTFRVEQTFYSVTDAAAGGADVQCAASAASAVSAAACSYYCLDNKLDRTSKAFWST